MNPMLFICFGMLLFSVGVYGWFDSHIIEKTVTTQDFTTVYRDAKTGEKQAEIYGKPYVIKNEYKLVVRKDRTTR